MQPTVLYNPAVEAKVREWDIRTTVLHMKQKLTAKVNREGWQHGLPGRNSGGEGDTVVDQGDGLVVRDVLPAGGLGVRCTHDKHTSQLCFIHIFPPPYMPKPLLNFSVTAHNYVTCFHKWSLKVTGANKSYRQIISELQSWPPHDCPTSTDQNFCLLRQKLDPNIRQKRHFVYSLTVPISQKWSSWLKTTFVRPGHIYTAVNAESHSHKAGFYCELLSTTELSRSRMMFAGISTQSSETAS